MLEERVAKWAEQWRQEGFEQGFQEGFQEGFREGKALLLTSVAGARFGDLDGWVVARIEGAEVEALDRWSGRFWEVERVEDLFDDSRP